MVEQEVVERGEGEVSSGRQGQVGGRSQAERLALLGEQVRPGALAHERTVEVGRDLAGLFPLGLQRGSTVAMSGPASISMAIAVAVASSQSGGWVMTVGLPSFGLVALLSRVWCSNGGC